MAAPLPPSRHERERCQGFARTTRRRTGRWLSLAALAVGTAGCSWFARPAPSQTLVVLAERDVEGLDPHTAGQVWQTQMVRANVYEALVSLDGQMALGPGLAASWSNPDDQTWLFRLRPGVRFHDGRTLTPDDVVFSLERARDHPHSAAKVGLAGVRSIAVVSADSVRLETAAPDAFLTSRLSEVPVISRACALGLGPDGMERASCGSGPYRVAARSPGDSVDLEGFEGYREGPAAIPHVRFLARRYGAADLDRLVPAGARLLTWARPGTAEAALAARQLSPRVAPGLAVLYLAFDLHAGGTAAARPQPFLDGRVREAVARAVSGLALDHASRAGFLAATQLVPPSVLGFDPGLRAPEPDVARARRLLGEAGHARGLEVELDLREIHAGLGPPLELALAAVGIRARSRVYPETAFFERLGRGEAALAVLRFSCWTGDAQSLYDKVLRSRQEEQGFGVFNFSYGTSPVAGLDEAIDAARRELDPPRRLGLLRAVMRRVLDAHLAVPLLQERQQYFASPDLAWRPRADTLVLARDASVAVP